MVNDTLSMEEHFQYYLPFWVVWMKCLLCGWWRWLPLWSLKMDCGLKSIYH